VLGAKEREGGRTQTRSVQLSPFLSLLPSFFLSFRLRVSECECVRAKESEKEKKGGNDDE